MRIVAGRWRGRTIAAPTGRQVRPTADRVREAWMSIVGPLLPDARVLDLFAGSGALGIEAVSRGAAIADLVEIAPASLRAIQGNIEARGAPPSQGRAPIRRGAGGRGVRCCLRRSAVRSRSGDRAGGAMARRPIRE